MSDDEQKLAPGTLFASYQILSLLGEGAFGVVYEAKQQPLGKRVALKVLRRGVAGQSDVAQRFLREAQMTAQIRHPHMVETFNVGAHEGAAYLAMEFLEGEALNKRLSREGRLSAEAALDVMLPVLSAMATVHDHGVVHRDLKPENIYLVRTRGTQVFPKVLDFGIAKAGGAEQGLGLTRTSTLLGTPYYMSPEQSRESRSIDARSDQWALGVIFYECLTGRRPFVGDSLLELLTRIATGRREPVASLCPEAPPGVLAVIDRLLQIEPSNRFADVREVGMALLPFASAATRARLSEEFSTAAAPHPRATDDAAPLWNPSLDANAGAALAARSGEARSLPTAHDSTLAPHESVASPSGARRGDPWRVAVAVAAVAVLGLGAWVALRGGKPETPHPSANPIAPPRSPARFRVRARVVPDTAVLVLDREAPMTGAIDRELENDGQTHRLIASAPGYRRAEFEFRNEFVSPEIVLVAEGVAPSTVAPPSVSEPPAAAATDGRSRRSGRSGRGQRRGDRATQGGAAEAGANGVIIR